MNDDIKVEKISEHLKDKSVALCVTGGIASIESVKIARMLRRHGADVKAYMTDSAQKFIGVASLEWATGNEVVTKLSGRSEHISLEDLVLVAPATANTISKVSNGIADNAVTTLISSALGKGKPVYFAPAFHKSLGDNPIFVDNLSKLLKYSKVIDPRDSEGKYKLAKLDDIIAETVRALSDDPLKGKKVLITAGPTKGYIDSVRYISNSSSGKLGLELAKDLYLRGADVTVVYGPGKVSFPNYIDRIDVKTPDEMLDATMEELEKDYDVAIFAAAVLDFKPMDYIDGKTKSGGKMMVELGPTKKIIKEVDKLGKRIFKVGFKLEYAKDDEELKDIGFEALLKNNCNIVVANDLFKIRDGKHKAYIITPEKGYTEVPDKKSIVSTLLEEVGRRSTATFYHTNFVDSTITEEYFSRFSSTGRELSSYDLLPKYGKSSFGNMSSRTDKGFVITSRKSDKSGMTVEDIVEVVGVDHENKKKFVKGVKKPSSDMLVHEAIYNNFPDVNAIIHVHDDYVVNNAEGLGLPVTEFDYPCGSLEAADEVLKVIGDNHYIVMKNHGVLALGKDLEDAKSKILQYRREK